MKQLQMIELFSGIGTQRKAFSKYFDLEVIGISEIDKKPLKIYQKLFNETNNFGDITKIESLPYADIWTYSFPCQDLSIAGNQKGLSGEKSSLLYEVLRILKNSPKPKILLMENVANLVSAKFIGGFEEWIELLKQEGYTTTWKKMKGCDYGGGTIRNRVFAISILGEEKFVFPPITGTNKTVEDYLEPADENFYVDKPVQDNNPKNFKNSVKICDYNNGGQGNRIYSINGQGITLTATGGGKGGTSGLYARKEGVYKLTPIEMAKMMGWSKEDALLMKEVASNKEISFCLGNAIEMKVLEALAQEINKIEI